MSIKEVEQIFDTISDLHRLMAMLAYGCGLRLNECLSLRIKDVDLEQNIVIVRMQERNGDGSGCFRQNLFQSTLAHT